MDESMVRGQRVIIGIAIVGLLVYFLAAVMGGIKIGVKRGREQVYEEAGRAGAGQWAVDLASGEMKWEWNSETHFMEAVIAEQHDSEFYQD